MKKLYETITAKNWTKWDYGIGSKRKCLSGHSISMQDGIEAHVKRVFAISEVIQILFPEYKHLDSGSLAVMTFNDAPNITVEDIIRVCKMADV